MAELIYPAPFDTPLTDPATWTKLFRGYNDWLHYSPLNPDFGALGDGVNDDGPAFNAAISAAVTAKKPFVVPPVAAFYRVATPIVVPVSTGFTWIQLRNSEIRAATNLNDYVLKLDTVGATFVSQAVFDGLFIDQNAGSQSGGGCIWAKGSSGCTFRNVRLLRPYEAGIWLDARGDASAGRRNVIHGGLIENGSVSGGDGKGIKITTNVENTITKIVLESMGGSGSEPWAIALGSDDQEIDGITIGSSKFGIRGTSGIDKIRVHHCNFNNCGMEAVYVQGVDWIVDHNVFRNGGGGASGPHSAMSLETGGGHIVSENQFLGPAAASQLRSFIRIRSSASETDTQIRGNRFKVDGALSTGQTIEFNNGAARVSDNIGFNDLIHVVKPSDESLQSNTTVQNDDHLFATLEPFSNYEGYLFLIYDADATADIKTNWVMPASATMHAAIRGATSSAASQSASVKLGHSTNAAEEAFGAVGTGVGNRMVAKITLKVTTLGAGGTLQLQWAQLASVAVNTTVLAGSYLHLKRVP